MGITPAPLNLWPLAWIALVPLWVLVVEEGTKRPPIAFLSNRETKSKPVNGWFFLLPVLWGIAYHGLALFWITGIHPMTWLGVPWLASLAIASFCWVFITLWGAGLVLIWALGQGLFAAKFAPLSSAFLSPFLRVLIGTTLWCSVEYLGSSTSLWWTSLAYTQSPTNLVILHLGQLSGTTAVTAAIVAVNGLIAEAWIAWQQHAHPPIQGRKTTTTSVQNLLIFLAIILFLVLHSLGFLLYRIPRIDPAETALTVGIIQGNIPNDIKLNSEGWRRALAGYTSGYQELADRGVDAVLTPETALPFLWTKDNRRYSEFYRAILDKGVLAWVGTFGKEGNRITNSLFTVTATGETYSSYDKVKLVPLGEFIPFEEILGRIINRLSPLEAQLKGGNPNQVFDTPFGRAIVGICYDSAFSALFRRQAAAGGEFIISASNDAHYTAAMAIQHHAQDVMRAIETDRWAIRATNTGYSAIVDPQGRTRWISELNTYQLHSATIYRRQTQTLYVRWGEWLLGLLWAICAIAFILSRRQ